MNKNILVVLVVLFIGGGAYYFFQDSLRSGGANEMAQTSRNTYTNEEYGITFTYPIEYSLSERDLGGSAERKRHVVTLIDIDDIATPEGGEGPRSISLLFVQNNLDSLTTDEWVRGSSDSNFKLSPDKGTAQIKIADKEGLTYRWDGLYNGETTVAAGREWIYAVSVTFDAENDTIVRDYRSVLNSIRFTK